MNYRLIFHTHNQEFLFGETAFEQYSDAVITLEAYVEVILKTGCALFKFDPNHSNYYSILITSQMIDLGGTFLIEEINENE